MNITELNECLVLRVSAADILNLRHAVLRAGLPKETAKFDGDDDRHTHHFATYIDDGKHVVCCATFMLNDHNSMPAWQLRGMATKPNYRSRGIGARLLAGAEAHLHHNVVYDHINTMWCNAREPAVAFYLQNGWEAVGAMFDIPTAGVHQKMFKHF